MRVATYNANSLRIRLEHFIPWLEAKNPDIVLIQEIKATDDQFPAEPIEALGYHCAVYGQKSYNGVAILSKSPMHDIERGLPNFTEDENARVIGATINGLRVYSLYVPNGNPLDSEKFTYKLKFMEHLYHFVRDELLQKETPFLLGGDFNVCIKDEDCYDPEAFKNDALLHPTTRHWFRALLNLGLCDSWRSLTPSPAIGYSFWDYQGGSFYKDHGLRIDYILLSPEITDHLIHADIDRNLREQDRPSDHTPVLVDLEPVS